ncbi:MAG TPA: DUF6036 family nucleotidyltransferase [Thermodesulfobacteriota bacterium]|nr:DUF6036 family nucleotidyltransferase [Thermodesulfobacteriota bacterium]
MFIYKLVKKLAENNIEYAIAGGYAVAFHGAVRGTVDIDLIIKLEKESFLKIEKTLEQIGLQSRLPIKAEEVFNFREEYINNRNLIAWNFINLNNPIESVDILLLEDLKKFKTININSNNNILKVVSMNDLIKMKKRSGRPQDIEDIKILRSLKQ